jgi:hypothetical protein
VRSFLYNLNVEPLYACSISPLVWLSAFYFSPTLCTLPLSGNFNLFVRLLWWECMLFLPFHFSMDAPSASPPLSLSPHFSVCYWSLQSYTLMAYMFSTDRHSSLRSEVQKPFTTFCMSSLTGNLDLVVWLLWWECMLYLCKPTSWSFTHLRTSPGLSHSFR